jgi:hypothetical protein
VSCVLCLWACLWLTPLACSRLSLSACQSRVGGVSFYFPSNRCLLYIQPIRNRWCLSSPPPIQLVSPFIFSQLEVVRGGVRCALLQPIGCILAFPLPCLLWPYLLWLYLLWPYLLWPYLLWPYLFWPCLLFFCLVFSCLALSSLAFPAPPFSLTLPCVLPCVSCLVFFIMSCLVLSRLRLVFVLFLFCFFILFCRLCFVCLFFAKGCVAKKYSQPVQCLSQGP